MPNYKTKFPPGLFRPQKKKRIAAACLFWSIEEGAVIADLPDLAMADNLWPWPWMPRDCSKVEHER